MQIYPAKYIDKNGEEKIEIRNDGRILRMEIRGVRFAGSDFDFFETDGDFSQEQLKTFTLSKTNNLCECTIFCEIPILILENEIETEARLSMKLELGKVTEKGWIDKEILSLTLKYKDFEFDSRGTSGWFEDELVDLQKQMPEEHKLKCCFGCAFSDYHVAGNGLFGDMLCFRNIKEKYLKVTDKYEFIGILDDYEEKVQETYLCPEFEIRKSGIGYRG